MKIIADTSVWIEFLKGNPVYFTRLRDLLENRLILGLDCVFAELLQGARNKPERDTIISYWENVPRIEIDDLFIQAGIYSSGHKLIAKGVGLIDSAIIISCHHYDAKIWTLDKKLIAVIKKDELYAVH
jgi:predicted nucleic acid-binding protein